MPAARPSRRSRWGLDALVFFVADVQSGFGPFVAVYLTAERWTQTDVGAALSVAGVVAVLTQVPVGGLIDAIRSRRAVAALALLALGASALAIALEPRFWVVLSARALQGSAIGALTIVTAVLGLDLVGRAGMAARFARNAAFSALGTGGAAIGMGLCGYYLSNRAVFFAAAALVVPALAALAAIRGSDLDPGEEAPAGRPVAGTAAIVAGLRALARDRAFVAFTAGGVLFQASYVSMLVLAAGMVALRSEQAASAMVAAAVVVQQGIVAVLAPVVGRAAQRWGRRPLFLAALAAVPLRGLLLGLTLEPRLVVLIQALDGVAIGILIVLVPLILADIAGRTGHFNLAQGVVGTAVGLGGAAGPPLVGLLADRLGSGAAFAAMTGLSALTLGLMGWLMPETRLNALPPTGSAPRRSGS